MEEINNRKDLLSNHTLAYRIFDSCSTPVTAQKAVLAVLNGQDVVQSSMCSGAGPLLGLIGESGSSQSIVLSRTVQPFQIPMVISFFFSVYVLYLGNISSICIYYFDIFYGNSFVFFCFIDKLFLNLLLSK